jgi:tellurite resistance protein TehA-like permease
LFRRLNFNVPPSPQPFPRRGGADLSRLTLQPHTIHSFTGVLILPIVTLVVLSATGGILCSVMDSTSSDALYRTMLGSYAALAIGFPLTHVILVLYFLRLLVHKVTPLISSPFGWEEVNR